MMKMGERDWEYAFQSVILGQYDEKDSAKKLIQKIENKSLVYHVAHHVFRDELHRLGELSVKEMEEPLTAEEEKEMNTLREYLNFHLEDNDEVDGEELHLFQWYHFVERED